MPLTPWFPHARTEGASRWKKRFDGSTSQAGPNSIRLSSGRSSRSPLRTWIRSLPLQALHFPQLSRTSFSAPISRQESAHTPSSTRSLYPPVHGLCTTARETEERSPSLGEHKQQRLSVPRHSDATVDYRRNVLTQRVTERIYPGLMGTPKTVKTGLALIAALLLL